MVISDLETKIQNYDITFNTLSSFFSDEKNDKLEGILKDRFNYIFLLEGDIGQKNFDNLKQKIYEIKEKIKNLELVRKDFNDFFYTSHSEDIKKIDKICLHLKMDSLNYFDKNFKNDYNYYMKYLENAQIRNKKKKSKFYNEIYDMEIKKSIDINDIDRMSETEKKFNEFKGLFENEGINKIDPKFLENYLIPFRNNNKNLESEIESELKTLIDIFEIKEEINLKEIIEVIILIYKRKYFLDISISINTFIEKISKTNFIEDIKDIIKNLNESKDINTIIVKIY